MNFDKNTIISAAAAVIGVVALVLSLGARKQVTSVERTLDFDTTLNVEVAAPEADPTRTMNPETGEYTSEYEEYSEANLNIILRDGTLRVLESTLHVPSSASGVDSGLYVSLPGEHVVRYDSTADYLIVDDQIKIKAISAVDATYNGICQFMGSDGQAILVGERLVNSNAGIAVVYELATAEVSDQDIATVQTILNNTKGNVVISHLTLFGTPVNTDWAENIVMTTKALELIKGSQRVYISPYSGTFADGATNTLTAGNTSFAYSDNIKDTATGYSPYIYTFNADQGGMVQASSSSTGQLKAKVLAQSNMIIKDLFGN